jgi:MFS family permease
LPILDHLKPPEPLARRELGVLALLGVVAFTQGWAGNVLTHTLALTRVTFELSDQRIADVQALVRGAALLALLFSWWGDHRGRRGPLLLAFFLLPVANLLTVAAPSLTAFVGLQAAARIGTIAVGALGMVVLAEEVRPAVRGYATAIFALFLSMGTGFGLLISPIAETGDEAWRLLFGLSGIPLLALPLLMLRLRESRAFRPGGPRPPLAAALKGRLARYFWPMAALSFAIASFTGPAANFILPRMVSDLGWSQGSASLFLVITSTPSVLIGLLVGGRAADLVGRRPTEVVSIFVGVAGGITFYFSHNGWIMGGAIFMTILGSSAFAPAFAAHRAELFPTEVRATATAWIVNAAIFGGLAGFAVGRFAIGAWGVPTTIAILGGLVAVTASVITLLPETRGTDLIDPETDSESPPGATPV